MGERGPKLPDSAGKPHPTNEKLIIYEYLDGNFIHIKGIGSGHGVRAKEMHVNRSGFSVSTSDDSGYYDSELTFTTSISRTSEENSSFGSYKRSPHGFKLLQVVTTTIDKK